LGLDEVSMNPQAIPAFKQAIGQLTIAQIEAIVSQALQQDSAAKVRAISSAIVVPEG
jgi:multiphosphoryl transfer protein